MPFGDCPYLKVFACGWPGKAFEGDAVVLNRHPLVQLVFLLVTSWSKLFCPVVSLTSLLACFRLVQLASPFVPPVCPSVSAQFFRVIPASFAEFVCSSNFQEDFPFSHPLNPRASVF